MRHRVRADQQQAPEAESAAPRVSVAPTDAQRLLRLQETAGNQMVVRLLAADSSPDYSQLVCRPEDDPQLLSYPDIPQVSTAPAAGLDSVREKTTVTSQLMLHAEEIFRDMPANFHSKGVAFANLQKARTPAQVEAATKALKDLIVTWRYNHELVVLKSQLASARKHKNKEKIEELEQAIEDHPKRREALVAEVDGMTHTDPGHTGDSVFTAEQTNVTHYDFAFADGEHVKLRDHVIAYATSVPFGVDNDPVDAKEKAKQEKAVADEMAKADISESRRKILKQISGFEGNFDTVNTYDRAKVTWGFVQWTGGHSSDLTEALSIIKKNHPDAFAKQFQAYGFDVVGDDLVITMPGAPPIKGDAAAEAIMRNPRLAAAMAHAGRDKEIQEGEVQAATAIEIDAALTMHVKVGSDKHSPTVQASQLITSEYGVGVLANTYVHSGSGKAHGIAQRAINEYLKHHPYEPADADWVAGAEAAIVTELAVEDPKRAAIMSGALEHGPGSFD